VCTLLWVGRRWLRRALTILSVAVFVCAVMVSAIYARTPPEGFIWSKIDNPLSTILRSVLRGIIHDVIIFDICNQIEFESSVFHHPQNEIIKITVTAIDFCLGPIILSRVAASLAKKGSGSHVRVLGHPKVNRKFFVGVFPLFSHCIVMRTLLIASPLEKTGSVATTKARCTATNALWLSSLACSIAPNCPLKTQAEDPAKNAAMMPTIIMTISREARARSSRCSCSLLGLNW
jgi:hypothetical protein